MNVFQQDVERELERARKKHPRRTASTHEEYAVLLEEVDEVKAEVWKRHPDMDALRKELVQVAAMAQKMAEDLLGY